jgi:hypothetical protein
MDVVQARSRGQARTDILFLVARQHDESDGNGHPL